MAPLLAALAELVAAGELGPERNVAVEQAIPNATLFVTVVVHTIAIAIANAIAIAIANAIAIAIAIAISISLQR